MGIFSRGPDPALVEMRSAIQKISDFRGFLEEIKSRSGGAQAVNRNTAQTVPAVSSCIKAIRDDMSGIPLKVYKREGTDGHYYSVPATDHPLYQLLKLRPNPEMKFYDWQKMRQPQNILDGNSYAFIERSIANPVKNIWPIEPRLVDIVRLKKKPGSRGVIRYRVNSDGISKQKLYKPSDILHVKNQSENGITGISELLTSGKDMVAMGLELSEFGKKFFQEGFFPSGFFKHPKALKNSKKWMDNVKEKFSGSRGTNTPMTLEDGMDFIKNEIKLIDSQYNELRKENKTDICGLLGVPLSRISVSDSNTNYKNSEQEQTRYFQSALLPIAIGDEQEFSLKLLSQEERAKGYTIKYNFASFLRADSKTQAEIDEIYNRMGLPLNRILAKQDRRPVDGGNVGIVQLNQANIEEVGRVVTDDET